MSDDEEWGVFSFFIGGMLTIIFDLLLFAIELTFEAVVLCLSITWQIVCIFIDVWENDR